jgi:hypothetical protein
MSKNQANNTKFKIKFYSKNFTLLLCIMNPLYLTAENLLHNL